MLKNMIFYAQKCLSHPKIANAVKHTLINIMP